MIAGTVIHWKDFRFHDGGTKNKYLVVMGPPRGGNLLLVKTTTQPHVTRPAKDGCQIEKGFFYFPAKRMWFPSPTWVILSHPYLVPTEQVQRAYTDKIAETVAQLALPDAAALRNCLKKSLDLTGEQADYLK